MAAASFASAALPRVAAYTPSSMRSRLPDCAMRRTASSVLRS